VTSRFINGGACALTWESFPDDWVAGCGGIGDIRRGVISYGVRLHSFIGQWSPSSISARRPAPQEIGERPFPLNDAEAGSIAAKGELLHVRTERGCRFARLYRLN
jgi:hypothetical protein